MMIPSVDKIILLERFPVIHNRLESRNSFLLYLSSHTLVKLDVCSSPVVCIGRILDFQLHSGVDCDHCLFWNSVNPTHLTFGYIQIASACWFCSWFSLQQISAEPPSSQPPWRRSIFNIAQISKSKIISEHFSSPRLALRYLKLVDSRIVCNSNTTFPRSYVENSGAGDDHRC